MSLKPPKKSELKNGWSKPRQDKIRRIGIEYQLIVTEGTKTEPQYFEGLKNTINLSAGRDKVVLDIEGTGKNTVWLMDRAKKLVKESPNPYRHVWLVYDKDDFPAERVNEVVLRCEAESNEETTYHAIWSNQCIELWYLLHFSYFHSDIDRNSYKPKLTAQLLQLGKGEYEKNREDMFTILLPKLNTALQNGKKLATANEGKTPTDSAPGTEMHTMMQHFEPYLKNV